MSVRRYLIMAGGTGGHIFPAMAVAQELSRRGNEVHWLGAVSGMENQLVPESGIPLHLIHVEGFRGKGWLGKIKAPFLLLGAVRQSWKIIRQLKPCVVIGFGGYVAAPGGIAAKLTGVPLVIHEQNSVAGSTNKLLAKLASCCLEAFPGSLPKAQQVGNPIRNQVRALFQNKSLNETKKKKNLLIMGGSLGALAINQIMPTVLSQIPASIRPNIWHQSGKNKLAELASAYDDLNIVHRTEEFIDDMAAAYEWADIVIGRAGALTISEIAVAGLPAIFIPYPYAIDNHQYHNARWLVDNGAAYLIEQKQLTTENLRTVLVDWLSNDAVLSAMSSKLKKIAIPDAGDQVADICEQLCTANKKFTPMTSKEHDNAA